jgi:hypothetical protein
MNGVRAYRAIQRLGESSPETIPFLRKSFASPPKPDEQRLARLIADLDKDNFDVRDKATRELQRMGPAAEPALRRALDLSSSPEARKRLDKLLRRLSPDGDLPPSRVLIALRVLEVLEIAGTPEARQWIEELAKGDAESQLAREAKLTKGRLARRLGESR